MPAPLVIVVAVSVAAVLHVQDAKEDIMGALDLKPCTFHGDE